MWIIVIFLNTWAEAQKPSWHGGIAIQKVFACDPLNWIKWIFSGWSGKFLNSLENFQIAWKHSD